MEHNDQVRQKIETWQTRMRQHDLPDLDQALFDFYSPRIANVSAIDELNRFLRDHPDPSFLCVTEKALIGDRLLDYDAEAFPDSVQLAGQQVPLSYAYAPGEEQDGVTLKIPRPWPGTFRRSTWIGPFPGCAKGRWANCYEACRKACAAS